MKKKKVQEKNTIPCISVKYYINTEIFQQGDDIFYNLEININKNKSECQQHWKQEQELNSAGFPIRTYSLHNCQ